MQLKQDACLEANAGVQRGEGRAFMGRRVQCTARYFRHAKQSLHGSAPAPGLEALRGLSMDGWCLGLEKGEKAVPRGF